MNVLVEQPAIHHVGISTESQRHPDYVSPETYLHSCPPIVNKKQLHRMYPECFNGIGKFKNYEYHINIKLEENAKPVTQKDCLSYNK